MLRLYGWVFLFSLGAHADARASKSISNVPKTVVRAPIGTDALLPCVGSFSVVDLAWRHLGTSRRPNKMLSNGSLLVENVSEADAGSYTCSVESVDFEVEDVAVVELVVLEPPLPVDGVEARANANFVTISWKSNLNDRQYLDGFRISYAVASDHPDWIEPSYLREIPPTTEIVDVYHLAADTAYIVRVESFNAAGSSRPVSVSFRTASAVEHILSVCGKTASDVHAEKYRFVWMFATGVALGAMCLAFVVPFLALRYRRQRRRESIRIPGALENADLSSETIELIPNIVVNPRFDTEAAQKAFVNLED